MNPMKFPFNKNLLNQKINKLKEKYDNEIYEAKTCNLSVVQNRI